MEIINFFIILLYLAGSYMLGAIPTSVVIARLRGNIDLSKEGSGNLGATNVARVIGKKFGIITLILDALKGFIPVFFALNFMHFGGIILALAVILPVVGHCYSVYIGFKGGKGVATALGVFLAVSPEAVLFSFLIFAIILFISRYVSLSSIISAFFMPFIIFFTTRNLYLFIASFLVSALIIFKHSGNIKRLMEGNEHMILRKN